MEIQADRADVPGYIAFFVDTSMQQMKNLFIGAVAGAGVVSLRAITRKVYSLATGQVVTQVRSPAVVKEIKEHAMRYMFVYPLIQACVFGGLVQHVILKRIPEGIASFVMRRKITFDGSCAKTMRVFLTTLLCAVMGIYNKQVGYNLLSTLITGLAISILKETEFGFAGHLGYQMMNNVIVVASVFWKS